MTNMPVGATWGRLPGGRKGNCAIMEAPTATHSGELGVQVFARDLLAKKGLLALLDQCPRVRIDIEVSPDTVGVVGCNAVDANALATIEGAKAVGCTNILLVAGAVSSDVLGSLIDAGVSGVVRSSNASPLRLAEAVQAVAAGGAMLPPDMVGRLIRHTPDGAARRWKRKPSYRLAEREVAVLTLLAEGLDTYQIAEELHYSERTIKGVVCGVTRRFGLRNRPHAVAFALREGLI